MSTTTIRLPDDLKKRLAEVATRAGTTSHALILQAVADRVRADEARHQFFDEAERRSAAIARTGQTIPWSQMREFIERRTNGEAIEPPVPRPLTD